MADMQYNQAYLDYMRRMGLAPSPQSYGDWMLRNNLGNPMGGPGITIASNPGTGPSTPPASIPQPTPTPGSTPQPSVGGPSAGGGSAGGSGGLSGGSTSTTTGGSSSMTPYVKSVTSNGGGGSDNSAILQQLIQSLTKSSSSANAAGLAQYQNLLNAIKGGSKQTMGYYKQAGQQIANFGQSQKADIEQTRLNQRAEVNQDMIGRGLGNTTILPTMLGGADTRATKANIALGDTVASMKSGLLERTGGMKFDLTKLMGDSILSKQNVGPDMGMYLNLIQMLGASGGSKSTPTPMR